MADGRSCPDRYIQIDVNRSSRRYRRPEVHNNPAYVEGNRQRLELFFRLISSLLFRLKKPTPSRRSFEIPPPVDVQNPNLVMVQPLGDEIENFIFPESDELYPMDGLRSFSEIILKLPKQVDQLTHFKNRGDAIYGVRQTVRNYIAEAEEGRWRHDHDPTDDASMKRIFFSSLGMFFITKLPSRQGFVADLTDMNKYVLRESKHEYEKYGCKTYFDEYGNIVKIEKGNGESFRPGDEHWEWAKLLSRTAVFMKAAFIHVGKLHYIWGNHPASCLRMFLPPNHPIRRAFFPHFYKTHDTCMRASFSLFDERGILGRGLSLAYEGGLKQVFFDYIRDFEYESYPDELQKQNILGCKLHVGATDGMDLHQILTEYVCDLFDEIYADTDIIDDNEEEGVVASLKFKIDNELKQAHEYLVKRMSIPDRLKEYNLDNVKEIWGEILFRVTGYHEAVGGVTTYCLDPAMVNVRIQAKDVSRSIIAPMESAHTLSVIGRLTKVPEPPKLGDDWRQVLENPDCQSYAKLRARLHDLERKIDIRNTVRDTNVDYHPRYCAISIAS